MFTTAHRLGGPVMACAAASALLLTGCGAPDDASSSAQSSLLQPASSAETSDEASSGEDHELALEILGAIVNEDFAAATAHFDPTMHQALPPDALASAWTTYQEQFGSYQSHGDPEDVALGDLTVVNVPLSMELRPGEFRITIGEDGTVVGLYLLDQGVPIS